jgi:hypothetical protein
MNKQPPIQPVRQAFSYYFYITVILAGSHQPKGEYKGWKQTGERSGGSMLDGLILYRKQHLGCFDRFNLQCPGGEFA